MAAWALEALPLIAVSERKRFPEAGFSLDVME